MSKLTRTSALLLIVLSLTACSAVFKQKVEFDVTTPLRVAVLPFHEIDEAGEIIDSEADIFLVDHIPGISETVEDSPSTLIHEMVVTELGKTTFEIVPPRVVTTHLVHNNFRKKLGLNHKEINKRSAKELCKFLTCDAVMFGRVLEWDRTYLGIETVSSIHYELKLVRATDNKPIFEAIAEDSDSRGISKGPTGYSSLVVEPIKGLSNEIIVGLGREMVAKSLAPLIARNRPEFLETPAPAIYSAAHNGRKGKVDRARGLVVLMTGSSGHEAHFSIGNQIEEIPMIEKYEGHYIGRYLPLESDMFDASALTVTLTDIYGRSVNTELKVQTVNLR